jgi:putative DNA primase/helicase
MRSRSILVPEYLQADGRLHRCDVEGGSRGRGDAAYVLHLDGYPAGGFENWRDGLGWQNWKADYERPLTQEERTAYRERMDAVRRDREIEKSRRWEDARERAATIWRASTPGPHPYLERKGVAAHGTRVYRGMLVIPVHDATRTLQSLQFISADGDKKFLRGGRIEGCYCAISDAPRNMLCIAEGYATGASIHAATGHVVAVAFNAGNLEPVARALRANLPRSVRLVICADDDQNTSGNPGLTKANQAARAVGAAVARPTFMRMA